MASTTTNYGWVVPTSSDLVKNGATAISTVGQSVDTFLFRPFTRNAIINGGMDVWQRGTTMTAGGTGYKSADRYYVNNNINPNYTFNQVASGFDSIRYAARIQRASGSTSLLPCAIGYTLETNDSIRFQGKTVTFSFYAKKGANFSGADFNGALYSGTGTDQQLYSFTGLAAIGSTISITPTTSWVRYTATVTVPTTATEIGFQLQYTPVGTAGTNDYIDVTGIQLEEGSQASPFTRAGGGTIQGELAACQRYYTRTGGTDIYENLTSYGAASASGNVTVVAQFPVTMRVAPTSIDYSTLAASDAVAVISISAVAAVNVGKQTALLNCTLTGATTYRPYRLITNGSTNGYLGFSAEL
jgi:hypothetical protein